MIKLQDIEKQIKELKLQKRQLLLSGKDTKKVDDAIENLEGELMTKNITKG
jgi:ABC-type phosphate transport system auxiliary subunit